MMPFTKQHSAYAWVVTCILFLINLTFHNLPLHSSYKIHQPFSDYFLRLPYSELLEKHRFRSRANRRLVYGSLCGIHSDILSVILAGLCVSRCMFPNVTELANIGSIWWCHLPLSRLAALDLPVLSEPGCRWYPEHTKVQSQRCMLFTRTWLGSGPYGNIEIWYSGTNQASK